MTRMSRPTWLEKWKEKTEALETQIYAVYLVFRHPRTPWYVKVLAAVVAAYALSPIDIIPDFIPVLGYLDDLLIVPLGVLLVIKLVPQDVMRESQKRAAELRSEDAPQFRWMGLVVVALWIVMLTLVTLFVISLIQR
jgi:uncharacterized membrane protein YkvA (DUF1232 family)